MLSIFNNLAEKIKKSFSCRLCLGLLGVGVVLFSACKEDETSTYDPYTNWAERNSLWYTQITDSALNSIDQAKQRSIQECGSDSLWEQYSEWRRFKSLQKDANYNSGSICDYVCVHIIKKGDHAGDQNYMPCYSDTVRLSYRGWLMTAAYDNGAGGYYNSMLVFGQTYYNSFNEELARPSLTAVAALVDGFSTALQYMTPGDDWYVYIPQNMGYGATASGSIPAYSTLLFRINLAAVYRAGSGVPTWY